MPLMGDSAGLILREMSTDFSWIPPLVLLGVFGAFVTLIWHVLVAEPREAKVKIAVEQARKAEMELRRAKIEARRRKTEIEVERPPKFEVVDHDQ